MKKFTTTFFIFSMVFCWVQSLNAQCVQCDTSSQATGYYSSVLGVGNISSGETSLASGMSNTSSGDYSTTLGYNNNADGDYSLAGGEECSANGAYAFAFGRFVQASGSRSLAQGKYVYAGAGNSVAIGRYVKSTTSDAMILGCGLDEDRYITNSISGSFMIGYNSNVHTFFVGSAYGENTTGRIGIGNVTEPDAKLHIRGDDLFWNTDDASLFIESAGNRYSTIYLGDQNHYIKTKPGHDLMFNAGNHNFQFLNGNTGFGTDDPQAKVHVKEGDIFIEDIDHGIVMKSPNGSCWRGTLTDEGLLQFAQVDCDDLMVSTPEPEPAQNAGIRIYPNPTGNHVTVEIPAAQAGARLSIKSSAGSELATKMLNNTRNTINMSSYPAGVYFFYISVDGKLLEVNKVVKE